MNPGRCPSPIDLERAFWSGDAAVEAHTEECQACGAVWAEISALIEVGRSLEPPAVSASRREEIRTKILAANDPAGRPTAPRRLRWLVAAPVAIAAAFAFAVAGWAVGQGETRQEPRDTTATRATAGTVRRGSVLDHDRARYLLAAPMPDEIVRLVDGTLTVEVDPLRAGERFRVVTGDSEVEVRGTAFDVTARSDRLVEVRVIHGVVDVRAGDAPPHRIVAGQRWYVQDTVALVTDARAAPPSGPAEVQESPADATLGPSAASVRPVRRPRLPADSGAAVGEATPPLALDLVAIEPAVEAAPVPDETAAPDAGPQTEPRPRSAAQQAFDEGFRAIRAGDFAAAAESFGAAEQSGGDPRLSGDAAFWRGVALARGGRAALAVEALHAYLRGHPESARAGEAAAMLGWLLARRGDRAEAEHLFRRALTDPSERIRRSAAEGLRRTGPPL